jgi:hypothetical protein
MYPDLVPGAFLGSDTVIGKIRSYYNQGRILIGYHKSFTDEVDAFCKSGNNTTKAAIYHVEKSPRVRNSDHHLHLQSSVLGNGTSCGLTTSLLFIDDEDFDMINVIKEVTNVFRRVRTIHNSQLYKYLVAK